MKVKYLRLKSWLLMSLMGLMGFASCRSHKQVAAPEAEPAPEVRGREEIRLMYGVPTMNYMIRGQVRDAEGRPVRDIRVNLLELGMEATADGISGDPQRVAEWLESTAVSTDRQGRFELASSGRPQQQVRLLVRDVDGAANGDFRNQLLEVPADSVDRSGAAGWHQGTFSKELDIRLDAK